MRLADLPTPCLVLDRGVLRRNLETMDRSASRLGVALRPHLKTAKSIDVAWLALAGPAARRGGGIAVSTLAEAAYFWSHGIADMLLANAITPDKLARVAALNAAGASVSVVTDDTDTASAIAAQPAPPRTLIEIDSGAHRAGVLPDGDLLLELARRLGPACVGVMTHAGHSYAQRTPEAMTQVAAAERGAVVRAAARLTAAGVDVQVVSVGSTPTALHAAAEPGVTEVRAGVYMFGDLFQSEIFSHGPDDIAVTVLASVIGRRPAEQALLIDAGAIALSMDRSTASGPVDWGYGQMRHLDGSTGYGAAAVRRVWQEHGRVELDPAVAADLPVGTRVRIAPNHICHTAAAHDRYFVVDGGAEVVAIWPRVSGW